MRRRAFIIGALGISGGAGCIGVNTNTQSGGDGGDTPTTEDRYAGGESTRTTTDTPDYPRIDAQRAAIRGALNDRRVDESSGALDVNSNDAATLRQLAQRHAERMADTGSVDIDAGGSLVDSIESEYGSCHFQADGSADRFDGAEVVFLGRVDASTATDPEAAADEFLGHWLNEIDTRPVLLSSKAQYLGLGLAYGTDELYVTIILC